MRAAEIAQRAFARATLANPANLADRRASAGGAAVANACESVRNAPALRSHSQPFSNPENHASAGDSRHSHDSQPADSPNWQQAGDVARDLIARLSQSWACLPGEFEELLELHRAGKLELPYIERLIRDAPPLTKGKADDNANLSK